MSGVRLDVQGLRALAIFAVLLFHFYPEYFPNGYLGVDIFFVISGFLIVSILKKYDSYSKMTFLDFYFRRMKRIMPLYLLYVCVAVVMFTFYAGPETIRENQLTAIAALFLSTNIHALLVQDDYFNRLLSDNLFTHTWSLAVEVQFYFIVPFLFWLNSKLLGKSNHFNSTFFLFISSLSLFLFTFLSPLYSFNVVFARFWQFFAVLCISSVSVVRRGYKLISMIYWIAFCSLGVPFLPMELDPVLMRIVVVVATALIIEYGEGVENSILSSSFSVFLGDISYSLYLVHWPLAVYFVKTTGIHSLERLALIPISFHVTVIIYYLFERNYRKWPKQLAQRFISSFYILSLVLIFLSAPVNMRIFESDIANKESVVADAIRENQYLFSHSVEHFILDQCNYSSFRNAPEKVKKPFGICTMPNGTGKLKFAVIGNSFAFTQADVIWKYFKPYFSSFRMYSESGCELFSKSVSRYCHTYANFTDVLAEFKPDVTFIVQCYMNPKSKPTKKGVPDKHLHEMFQHMDVLRNLSSLYFVMDSIPSFRYGEFRKMNNMLKKNMTVDEINTILIRRNEDDNARPRTKKLAEYCGSQCHFYDIETVLTDDGGRFSALDPSTLVAYFEPGGHLAPHGKEKTEPLYQALAKQYDRELRDLEHRLYPDS